MLYNKHEQYPFLNERLSKEAHIEEVLAEIETTQRNWIKTNIGELATIESLNESRNIKLPITQKRILNIKYLVDLLMKDHPLEVKPVYSFKFIVNPENKNLTIDEKMEITFMMREADHRRVQSSRDQESAESLIKLLESFRLFNLTKLIQKSKNRAHLAEIVKSQLGINIFTFKNFSLDKNQFEVVEDYCFHKNNYDSVKSKINLEKIQNIIETNESAISRRLKNFGILNSSVSDYTDNKLDYILNILTGDLAPSVDKRDLVEIKNFKYLRECMIKVDKLIDPAVMLDSEIMKHLSESFITTEKEIMSLFANITEEALGRWEADKYSSGKVIIHLYNNIKYLIDPSQFLSRYQSYISSIIYSAADEELSETQRNSKIFTTDMLTDAANQILEDDQNAQKFFTNTENSGNLRQSISEYLDFKRTLIALKNANKSGSENKTGTSFLTRIANSIIMLFTKKDKNYALNPAIKKAAGLKKVKSGLPQTTKDLYKEISQRKSPLLPLSDFIEIKPENESIIENLVTEIRNNNLKIIIPMYNARQMLYPQRSRKYLLSDVEYLMIDPERAVSPENIRDYIDSITGFKLKEDTITGSALFNIEKYLMSIYRQNRAKMKKSKT